MGARTFSDLITFTRASTGTYTGSNGLLQTAAVDQSRIDYNPATGEKLGLLVEEQRTNLLSRSSEFDNASWTKSNVTVTANATTAPDGTLAADVLTETTATGAHSFYRLPGLGIATYTYSFYAKANGRTKVQVSQESGGNSLFTLSGAGTATAQGANTVSIQDVGNGWYRCSTTFTVTGAFGIYMTLHNGSTTSYTGDGTSGIYVWGAQLETGAFPTSYIPTTTAQVTRSADVASITGTNFSDWYRQEEGTLYVAYSTFGSGTGWGITMGGGSDYISLLKGNSGGANRLSVVTGGVTQGTLDFAGITTGTTYKLAGAYKANDLAASLDGATPLTDASASIPTVSSATIGSLFTQSLNGHIKSIKYYPKRLTDAELQALTA